MDIQCYNAIYVVGGPISPAMGIPLSQLKVLILSVLSVICQNLA